MEITKEDFREYESIRVSGLVNMYALPMLGYDKKWVQYIMENYDALAERYSDVVREEAEKEASL
jgi:hypothetical protein